MNYRIPCRYSGLLSGPTVRSKLSDADDNSHGWMMKPLKVQMIPLLLVTTNYGMIGRETLL